MKSNKAITMVSLVVTILILIILAGVSINMAIEEDGIITVAKRAKENIEIARIEEESKINEIYTSLEEEGESLGELSYDTIAKLNNFKKAIADYIEEAGGIKPEYTANVETFGESIKEIVKEVTKDATATADNITEGKTAWINGEKITGTGKDNEDYYQKGTQESTGITWVKLGTVNGIYGSQTKTFDCTNIPNYKNLTNKNFTFKLASACLHWGWLAEGSGTKSSELNANLSNPTLQYNAETGKLKVTCNGQNNHSDTNVFSGVYPGFTFYCIY